MSVGVNIKKKRLELNMSQQELADAMGYKTRSTIAKIESGENDVTQKKLLKFANILDTTVEYLMGINPLAGTLQSSDLNLCYNTRTQENKVVAIIPAGGKSVRNHKSIPNQFIDILGKPVIVYCLEAYQKHPSIDDIYVVCLKGWESIITAYAKQYEITKLRGLIPAASSGIRSVENGLEFVKNQYADNDIVIFQESTRPMVNVEMISKLLQACYVNGCANICHKMKDYVQFTYTNGKAKYINRDEVVDLQSPEAYRFDIITNVFFEAQKRQHPLTESCCAMLMFNLGIDINFIEGSVNNIKIIRDEDIAVFEALLRK